MNVVVEGDRFSLCLPQRISGSRETSQVANGQYQRIAKASPRRHRHGFEPCGLEELQRPGQRREELERGRPPPNHPPLGLRGAGEDRAEYKKARRANSHAGNGRLRCS